GSLVRGDGVGALRAGGLARRPGAGGSLMAAGDLELQQLLERELERQQTTLQLIASENFTSRAVMAATGSVLTNKYSQGYPHKRYYGANRVVDDAEDLARQRASRLVR